MSTNVSRTKYEHFRSRQVSMVWDGSFLPSVKNAPARRAVLNVEGRM